MGDTKIEWTDKTWNPVTGCSKVSAGCKFCYAERIFQRPYPGRVFTDLRIHTERLEQPLHWKNPCRIFVNSMSDLFHEGIPADFIVQIFEVMAAAPRHTFQILTKRPERIKAVLFGEEGHFYLGGGDYYPHIWLGVSMEDQSTADERISSLLSVGWMGVNFASYEPALGPVGFCRWLGKRDDLLPSIGWVIAGGESGPHARPSEVSWYRSARDECRQAGVPFFMKQLGGHPDKRGKLYDFPKDLRVRKFPH